MCNLRIYVYFLSILRCQIISYYTVDTSILDPKYTHQRPNACMHARSLRAPRAGMQAAAGSSSMQASRPRAARPPARRRQP